MTDYMEKLKQLAKHSIQLSIGGEETYRAGATRFGGRPDVPSDFVWPTFKGERSPIRAVIKGGNTYSIPALL